jgi:tetratricopeptide (TPR) repeat protein
VRKFGRRNQPLMIAVAVAMGALLVATGTSLVFAIQQRQALAESRQARLAESEQRILAEQHAREASLVIGLLERALVSPNPAVSGRDVRVVDVLAQAEESLERDLADEPQAAAHLGTSIGVAHLGLGNYADAERCFTRAMERWNDADAGERQEAMHTRIHLTMALARQGRISEALGLVRAAAEESMLLFGPHSPHTITAHGYLAIFLMEVGELHAAEEAVRKAIAMYERAFGPDHPRTLGMLDNLAAILFRLKRAEAADVYEEMLQRTMNVMGEDHLSSLSAMANYAQFIMHSNPLRAEELLRTVVSQESTQLGRHHPRTLTAIHNLGMALALSRQLDEAEMLLSEALEVGTAHAGPHHPTTLASKAGLGGVRFRQGRHEEAEQLLLEVLEAQRSVRGEIHQDVFSTVRQLADMYTRQRRLSDAEQMYAQAAGIAVHLLGQDHPTRGRMLFRRGATLLELGRHAEAERDLLDALEVKTKSGAAASRRRDVHSALAELYEQGEDPAKASHHRKHASELDTQGSDL